MIDSRPSCADAKGMRSGLVSPLAHGRGPLLGRQSDADIPDLAR